MVHVLLAKTDKVIAAAKAEGVINQNDELDKRFFFCADYWEMGEDAVELERKRVDKEIENMPIYLQVQHLKQKMSKDF